jgi:hypothetical protein
MKERLLAFLDGDDYAVSCRWINKNTYGITRHDIEEVHINIYAILTSILVHEYLHVRYPQLSEETVDNLADRAMQRLSKSAIIELATRLIATLSMTDAAEESVEASPFPNVGGADAP